MAGNKITAGPCPTEEECPPMTNRCVKQELGTEGVLEDLAKGKQLPTAEYDNIHVDILQHGTSIYYLRF